MKHKLVKAVEPYIYPEGTNFKHKPYEAWKELGGQVAQAHYPPCALHGLAFRYELPSIVKKINSKLSTVNYQSEARLRFVEPVSLYFDTFPDYAYYEVIPFVWDCWPRYFEKMCSWLGRHDVQTAIFTSSQTAERMRERFPQMNVMFCPEAVDASCYIEGKPLKERNIDLLEFGRSNEQVFKASLPESVKHVCTMQNGKYIYTNEQLYDAMGDAKVTITLPRSYTQPEIAGDIETLTQRYWECMLSRIVMVGHAPKELVDLIGYNPVIELEKERANGQIQEILANLSSYQELVDKNRDSALNKGDWKTRVKDVMNFLQENDYQCQALWEYRERARTTT